MEAIKEQAGIVALKESIDLVIDTLDAVKAISSDGKVGLDDLGALISFVKKVGPLVGDMGKVPSEVKDLSLEEVQELIAYVALKLSIPDEHAMKVVDASLKLMSSSVTLLQAVKAPAAPVEAPAAPVA